MKTLKRFQFDIRIWIGILGAVIVGIALLSLLGYGLDYPRFYNWNGGVGMAINTAIDFVLTGSGLVWIALSERLWK